MLMPRTSRCKERWARSNPPRPSREVSAVNWFVSYLSHAHSLPELITNSFQSKCERDSIQDEIEV